MSETKLLHLAAREPNARLFTPAFLRDVKPFGELEIVANAAQWSEAEIAARIRNCDVLLTGWGCVPVPLSIAENRGEMKYICHLTGEMRRMVPPEIIRSGISVTNWGDAPSFEVAEAALALLFACLKNVRQHVETKRAGGWHIENINNGSLRNLRLGIYGFGVIGRKFYELCQPFGAEIMVFDPFAPENPGVRAQTLDELFGWAHAVAIHAGLTEQTRSSVNAARLAMLPDSGIVVNTARGGIIDQEALFAELESGRLRAALDVLEGNDSLPPHHAARGWPNLILTAHQASSATWPPSEKLLPLHEVALENLRRFQTGESLRFVMDEARYQLST